MAKFKIKHTISKKEWNKTHKDFKSIIDGIHYVMKYDNKTGTHLVPVNIEESVDENFAVHMAVAKAIKDAKVKNPDTKKDVKVTTALKDKEHPAHKQAKSLFQRIKDKVMGEEITEMDMNDPILVKLRAAQMRKNKDAAKKIDTEKQNKNAIKIKALKKKRAEVMRDMEQEAEPEGGKIADRYGKLLNKIDNDIIKLGGNPMSEGMVKPRKGHTYYQLTKDFPVKYITGKYGMGLEVPGVLIKNKSGYIDGKKGAYLIDYFDALYYVDMKNKFASPVYSLRDQDKFSRGSITQVDMAPEFSDWKKFMKESVNENDGVYFKSYTAAIEAARAAALKKGFEVDDDEMFTKVGMNSKRPSVGKTTRVSLELTKAGKPQRKMLHIQVYGMKNGYELNSYIN